MHAHPLIAILLFPVLFSCNRQQTVTEIISKSRSATGAIKTLEYAVDYKVKYFTQEDTLNLKGECLFEMVEADTLLGFKAWIKQEIGYEHIYTVDKLYVIDHNDKHVLIDDPKKNGVGFITGNVVEDLIFLRLVKGIDIEELEADSVAIDLVRDGESETHWVVRLTFPDDEDFKESVEKIWINKSTYLPEKMTFRATWQDMFQYDELSVSDIKINLGNADDRFSSTTIPEDYVIQYFEPPDDSVYETLENGVSSPDFELTSLNGRVYKLSDLKGKVVLLDFWYMSCYPCIKALPHLEELYKTYHEKGLVVIGMNSKDNNERKDKLKDFLAKRDITYPTVLANNAIDSSYNVKAYPTLYLIDKQGKVLFSQLGFGEATKATLEQRILVGLE